MLDHIHFDTIEGLKERLMALPHKAPAVFISTSMARRCGLAGFLEEKSRAGWCWVTNTPPNPTSNTLAETLAQLAPHKIDAMVAIGGGSTIDLAKATKALYGLVDGDAGDIKAMTAAILGIIQTGQFAKMATPLPALPLIAAPTTAGTGSEVTPWATVWDAESPAKYSVNAPWLVPDEVWVVPALLGRLPARLMLSTGLDALCQASEAYWAKATDPLAQGLSLGAVVQMMDTLPQLLANPTAPKLQTRAATASLLAGLAFSHTRTTACHSISYPLTALFGIEHGFAVALTLAPVVEINSKVADCGPLLDIYAQHGGIRQWLDKTCAGIQPLRLGAFGVGKGEIPRIAQNAFTAGRMDNNPAELDTARVEEILKAVL